MKVKELRDALADMPGEMPVYLVGGTGVASAQHLFGFNLVRVEQWCELAAYGQSHTENMLDSLVERETGFKNREELIAAYKGVLALTPTTKEETNVE
jgi:hypothetical protein